MISHADFARIVAKIAPQSKLVGARPLSGGISAKMTRLEIQTPDGRTQQLVLRQQSNAQALKNQYKLLQLLNESNVVAPKPRYLDSSGQILPEPYLVLEFVAGEMDFAPTNLSAYLQQLAGQLAHIHSIDCANHDLNFLPTSGHHCSETERELLEHNLFDAAQIREVLYAVGVPQSSNGAALLHGDFWPGNSLWQNGLLTAVIDWEDAGCGDPLIDLAQSRSEIVWIFGVEALHEFTAYYQSLQSLDVTNLPYWDLCAALRFVRLAGGDLAGFTAYFAGYGRNDITAATIEKDMRFFIQQACEKIG